MQKTKLALVSLLSLLVVLAPAASALAQTSNVKKPVKTKKKELSSNKATAHSGVFNEIKKEGAKPVSDKKLDEKKGEGPFGALVGAAVGGAIGLGVSIYHGVSQGDSPGQMAQDAFMDTCVGIGTGATVGGLYTAVF